MPDSHPASFLTCAQLTGSQGGRVKRLSGYNRDKGHFEPKEHSDAARTFIRNIGASELETHATALHQQLRSTLSLKRKELTYLCDAGDARISTPHFEISTDIAQDDADPKLYRLQTTVHNLKDESTLQHPGFLAIFSGLCNTLVLELPAPIDVESTIDFIEDKDALAPHLDYPPDATSLTLTPAQSGITLHLTAHQARFSIPTGGDLGNLVTGAMSLWEEIAFKSTSS